MSEQQQPNRQILNTVIDELLAYLDQDREREIITRRFGLRGTTETLEQIGEVLGITRERVRQLEKAILIRLKIAADDNKINSLPALEKIIVRFLIENGQIMPVNKLTKLILSDKPTAQDLSLISFVSEVSSKLVLINENDAYRQAVGIATFGDLKTYRQHIDDIIKIIKDKKQPVSIDELDQMLNFDHPNQIIALANISKKIANLDNLWGLASWPSVNPKNIKDKIYVILKQANEPMHFSNIAQSIAESNFKRKNVTEQAIHNELIKDKRFVLIGRGIYALDEWGYSKGTVADIIADVIKENGEPMYRDDIVKKVLKRRKVKETTVLLNLQARPEFKRVAKATYDYLPVAK
ncbi:MAG: sigma factor-like helix-turn-helix DNA-binding protein [Candidatus Saccharibacteria bacterium]|nr:sigma factor-like helix-turn-helix DNA-binding protein [Candidatus Saccharibacteria bacterium]